MTTIDFVILWSLLLLLLFFVHLLYDEELAKKEDFRYRNEKSKLEELKEELWPEYQINIHVWLWDNKTYYITKSAQRTLHHWFHVAYTLWELEKIVSTIKAFDL